MGKMRYVLLFKTKLGKTVIGYAHFRKIKGRIALVVEIGILSLERIIQRKKFFV